MERPVVPWSGNVTVNFGRRSLGGGTASSRENLRELARQLRDFFEEAPSLEDPQRLGGKLARALDLCEETLESLSWEDPEQLRGGTAVEGLLAALRDFELAYDAYAEFQRSMERYWCLRWIEQEHVTELDATVIRDNLVRCNRLPLVMRVPSLRDAAAGATLAP